MISFRTFHIFVAVVMMSCAPTPKLPGSLASEAEVGSYPRLAPLSELRALSNGPFRATPESQVAFDGRIASLRTRAAQLARPVVDPVTRSRMDGAVARAALR